MNSHHYGSSSILFVLTMLLLLAIVADSNAQAPTSREKVAIRSINSKIDQAEKLYLAKKFDRSSQVINKAMDQMKTLTSEARAELLELAKPEYDRLQKAHELLSAAGQTLPELAEFPTANDGSGISFSKRVAPILVNKCGQCHVNRNRGNFSMATYTALEQSTKIAFGLPQDSRLIEVIESGEMPKGEATIDPEELQVLQDWIQQGAKFDGEDPQQNLMELTGLSSTPAGDRLAPQIAAPTGNETVSFGLQIAPILVEHCGQCHMANNPRGGFNQSTFDTLLAGGIAGPPIVPGKSQDSFLFKRIAAGEMPPNGKLNADLIKLIGTWIEEGATFDGRDPKLALVSVAATAKAVSQTHEELADARQLLAADNWKLTMGRVAGSSRGSKNFRILGASDGDRLDRVAELLENLQPKISDALKAASSQPFVKGNVSVFVFEKRYDFSEFGKMVEQRDFSSQLTGQWNYTISDAYAAILLPRNQPESAVAVSLTQQLAALHIASLAPDVPRWFADGVGYWTAKKLLSNEDEVKSWDADAVAAASSMKQPDDFIENRMPADRAGLVSYLFVKKLKSKGSSFNRLIDSIRAGKSFEQSFVDAYGTSATELLNQAYAQGW